MINSADPGQTVPEVWVCTVCICYFVRIFCVQNFRTFTINDEDPIIWITDGEYRSCSLSDNLCSSDT